MFTTLTTAQLTSEWRRINRQLDEGRHDTDALLAERMVVYRALEKRVPRCHLCDYLIQADEEQAEYDDDGIDRPIHLACGQADNEDRAEAMFFQGGCA